MAERTKVAKANSPQGKAVSCHDEIKLQCHFLNKSINNSVSPPIAYAIGYYLTISVPAAAHL